VGPRDWRDESKPSQNSKNYSGIHYYLTISLQNSFLYAQVKRADEARLAGSKRARNQGPCQAQDWIVERKEDVSSWEDFLGMAYN
jgi:hypothetical protein